MADICVITFTGRLTRDSETRYSQSNTAVLSFDVANNVGFGDNEKTNFFKCAMFGKRAEGRLVEFLKKGADVTVTGELSLDVREHNGKTYTDMKVRVADVRLHGGAGAGHGGGNANGGGAQRSAQSGGANYDDIGDIPF